jgi:hypothetical protein
MTLDGEHYNPVETENVCIIFHSVFNVRTDSVVRNVFMVDTLFTEFPYSINIACKWSIYHSQNTVNLSICLIQHRTMKTCGEKEGIADAFFIGCECSSSRRGHSTAVDKNPRYPMVRQVGWAPEPICLDWGGAKNLMPLPGIEYHCPDAQPLAMFSYLDFQEFSCFAHFTAS